MSNTEAETPLSSPPQEAEIQYSSGTGGMENDDAGIADASASDKIQSEHDAARSGEDLLVDVTRVLHEIVSSSDVKEADGGDDGESDVSDGERAAAERSNWGGRQLTGQELTSLRRLEERVRLVLSERRSAWRRTVTGHSDTRVRDHARESARRAGDAVRKTARRALTGSDRRAIRDWAKEAKVVKTVDKFAFCLGVFLLTATEYVALRHPQRFGMYYVAVVSIMMVLRLYMYARNRWIYFLLDFCYFANASCFLAVLVMPDNTMLWRLNYAVSNGVLLAAILAWRNSFVFHSLDKVTSIAIHVLPGLLTYLERWSEGGSVMCLPNDSKSCALGILGSIVEPTLFYLCWQILYIVQTEIIDRKRLSDNPSIQTSLRWLTRDKNNAMHKAVLALCRSTGIFHRDETFDASSMKTKLIFWIGNLLFSVATLVPVPLMFCYQDIHTTYLLFVLSSAVWNGANYYFEVFANRYIQKLEMSTSAYQVQDIKSSEKNVSNQSIIKEKLHGNINVKEE